MREYVLRFNGISLQRCESPEWYDAIMRDADEKGGELSDVYRRNSVHLDHQYGEHGHSVMVYNAGAERGHLIEYWDASTCLAVVLIDDIAAYLDFRAKYLFAWAWLIKEMDRIADADYEQAIEQQRKRA